MTRFSIYLFFVLSIFLTCKNPVPEVNLAYSPDPDIVLVNIENGNREFIGKLLMKIDSLNPLVIGIDVFFLDTKTPKEDSMLIQALRKSNNDILCYGLDHNNKKRSSDTAFTKYAMDVGLLKFDYSVGLISRMTPLLKLDNKVHGSFAYKILKLWKPEFKSELKINQEIPINYQRPLEMFLRLDGSFLLGTNIENFDLKNKVFLLGYIGPSKEDKHFSPLRFIGKELEHNEPDTYGLVIIANQIRTILEYNK